MRPGASEREVELLLFDEGILADRRVWNACEELELDVRITESATLLFQLPKPRYTYLGCSFSA